ncbi:hypothetical protein ACIBL8_21765 [Streptomyces sp. NPDC050523]|uniref:hypothetical protein n=1 Tax=Streptomyces sp. NPDC050523 TaxID=3365622 RepID=UPI0037B0EBBD
MSARITPTAGAREIAFAPARPDDMKVEPGIGYLTPGGLVVHTGWSRPLRGEPNERSQHPAYEGAGAQPWLISTPDGHRVATFPCQTRPDAEAAAAAITAALPGGRWPEEADLEVLLPTAREASSAPALLPFNHKGKPYWGSGYGLDNVSFYMPDSRVAYERMIDAHGRIPSNCPTCARLVRRQKKAGWLPATNHWPVWRVHGGRPDHDATTHCSCGVCIRMYLRMGTFGPAVDDAGETVIGSIAVYPWSDGGSLIGSIEREERPFAWFAYLLKEGGCVVIDERSCSRLWPEGVQHDDALFCETGETGADETRSDS